jgi:hypothetical protein
MGEYLYTCARQATKQPSNAKQCQAMPSNAKQCQAMPSNAKQCQQCQQIERGIVCNVISTYN